MKLWVGITDYDWFKFHASQRKVEEVNFWNPSAVGFRALPFSGPFLFKLKSPRNVIAGGGFFVRYEPLPLSRAWELLGAANGANSLAELRFLIARNRHEHLANTDDPIIGCTILTEPFFFKESDWIPFRLKPGIQRGATLDMESPIGKELWSHIQALLPVTVQKIEGPATIAAQENERFGRPSLIVPRLGQGGFRVLVTDAYERRCAMTSERTLPALEAAHIHRYSAGGDHSPSNGLLLRSDLHRLFDRGYLAVEPNTLKIRVSPRIREEFENGRDYYALNNVDLRKPIDPLAFPSVEKLTQHYDSVFKS